MILSLAILLLFIFYTSGGFKKLLEFYRFSDPEPLPNLYQGPKPEPAPVEIIPEPVKVEPVTIPDPEPLKPAGDRRQLEKVAASCLYRLLTPHERENINIFSFCRDASDAELINIIERFKNEY